MDFADWIPTVKHNSYSKKLVSPPSNRLALITTKKCSINLLSRQRKVVLAQTFLFTVSCANLSQYQVNYGQYGNTVWCITYLVSILRLQEVAPKTKPSLKSLHKWQSICLSTQMRKPSSRFPNPPQGNTESCTTFKTATR